MPDENLNHGLFWFSIAAQASAGVFLISTTIALYVMVARLQAAVALQNGALKVIRELLRETVRQAATEMAPPKPTVDLRTARGADADCRRCRAGSPTHSGETFTLHPDPAKNPRPQSPYDLIHQA